MTEEPTRPADEAVTETAVNPAVNPNRRRRTPAGATSTKLSDKLPLLTFLGRNQGGNRALAGGAVGVLILGAIALVVALVAVTIAIGRAPQQAAANPQQSSTASQSAPSGPTSFASPEQTGVRWSPLPIQTGIPQFQPSYEPTPTPKPSPSPSAAPEPTAAPPPPQATAGGAATSFGRPADPPGQATQPAR